MSGGGLSGDGVLPLACVAIRQETPSAKTYTFALPDGAGFGFEPGQFVNLVCPIDGEDHLRSYSLSSSALRPGRISITVKRVGRGLVSNWLFDHLRVGDRLGAAGLAGVFCCGMAPEAPVLLLTAGSGITPAASMLRSLSDLAAGADIVLIHFADRPEEIIFRDEMAHWARNLPCARIVPVVTRPPACSGWVGASGRLSPDLLRGLVPDLAARRVYCCGPAGFMARAAEIVADLGLPVERFVTESFARAEEATPPPAEAGAAGFAVSFARSGKEIRAEPGGTVLRAAKAADVRILSSCNKGLCGTCRVKMLSGTVEMTHQGGIRPREIDQGFILACCSRPTSDVVIDR